MSGDTVLQISDLTVGVRGDESPVILSRVNLSVQAGEKVGLVGQSGSGKSMLSLSTIGLLPDAIDYRGGSVTVAGTEIIGATEGTLNSLRGAAVSMIYQDPMSSLNPVHTVGRQISEAITTHERVSKSQARERAVTLLDDVGVYDAHIAVDRYPHEFSGGMRQRVMIAMAIACGPQLLLADEPTTALDVTTQARIIELLSALVTERHMGVVFVTHDLAVAASFCDRIAVMHEGVIVEEGPVESILTAPTHPYTQSLVSSIITLHTDPDQPIGTPQGREDQP